MDYITRETLNKYVKDKSVIQLKDFAEIFEKEFGIVIPLGGKMNYEDLTEVQRMKMTKAIFSNENVIEQLRKASTEGDYFEDSEEALKIIYEARDGH
jgi:hypothetical protein